MEMASHADLPRLSEMLCEHGVFLFMGSVVVRSGNRRSVSCRRSESEREEHRVRRQLFELLLSPRDE